MYTVLLLEWKMQWEKALIKFLESIWNVNKKSEYANKNNYHVFRAEKIKKLMKNRPFLFQFVIYFLWFWVSSEVFPSSQVKPICLDQLAPLGMVSRRIKNHSSTGNRQQNGNSSRFLYSNEVNWDKNIVRIKNENQLVILFLLKKWKIWHFTIQCCKFSLTVFHARWFHTTFRWVWKKPSHRKGVAETNDVILQSQEVPQ